MIPSPWRLALCAALLVACTDNATRTTHSTIALRPALLDFGAVAAGSSRTLTLTIANDGKSTLNVTAIRLVNDARGAFTAGAAPAPIGAGASADVSVIYAAAAGAASDSATFVVDSDADNAASASVPLVAKSSAPACDDGVKNGKEAAVDCGGGCPGCAAGTACASADDCAAGLGCAGAICGACTGDASCRTGQRCAGGVCEGCTLDADCADGSTCVSGSCTPCPGATGRIDTRTDPANCGACGHACPAPANAAARCVAGACGRGPCESGHFDFDGAATFGCETACAGRTCTAADGTVTTLASAPIPESALGLQGFASGSSYGSAVQTGPQHTHLGVLGDSTPPPAGGASELRGTTHRLQGGIDATMR